MTTLNIQGRRVTVDDGFKQLSPEQQAATVEEIAKQIGIQGNTTTPAAASDPIEVKAQSLADRLEAGPMGKEGAGDLFQNAFTFGLKDKVAGLAGAAGAIFDPDMSMREGYNISRRAQEIMEERARERTGTLGTVAEVAGSVGTGVLAKAPAAATAIGRVVQGASEAGKLAVIKGVGDSESDSLGGIAGDALVSGATGAAAGGALSGIVEAGKGAISALRASGRAVKGLTLDAEGKAGQKVLKALTDDGITPNAAAARMNTRDTALINTADENLLGLGRAAAAKPGEGRATLNKALDAQQKASQGKVIDAVNDTLGGGDKSFNTRVADMIKTRSGLAKTQYDAAFAKNFGDAQPMIFDDLAKRVPSEAVRNAEKIAKAEGRAFGEQLVASIDDAGNVTFGRQPSLREWHYIQRGLRSAADSAYTAGVGEVGTAYKGLHREILDAMDDASPLYKAAREKYAGQSDMIDALQRGRELLNPSSTRNVDALGDEIADMSKAEREMVRIGLARQLQDLVESTPDRAGDMVNKIFGTAGKRGAIRAAFESDTAFRKFEAQMRNIAKETKSFQFVRTGSRTSFVDAEKADASVLADAAQGLATAATGGLSAGTLLAGASRLLKDVGGMDENVAREVAKILVTKDADFVKKALAPAASSAARKSATDQLLIRARPFVRALTVGTAATTGAEVGTAR